MTGHLLEKYTFKLRSLTLIPGVGGRFEVKVDGQLVFSKLRRHDFPKDEEITAAIDAVLKA